MQLVKPTILLIYTGGTIGMIKDSLTGALKAFDFKELFKKYNLKKLDLLFIDVEGYDADLVIDFLKILIIPT